MGKIAGTSKHLNTVSMESSKSAGSNAKGRNRQATKAAASPPQDKYIPSTSPSGPKKMGLGG